MKKLIILFVFVVIANFSFAQGFFGITYDIALPMGEMRSDFIEKTSFRGLGLEGRSFLTDNLSLGGSFAWQTFYEETGVISVTEGTITATGKQYRYVNSFPIMVTGHYYLAEDGDTRLYFGTGIGTFRIMQRTDMGMYLVENNNWRFGIVPEVGVLIPINFNNSLQVAMKYNYAFKTSDTINISYLSFNLGFAFM